MPVRYHRPGERGYQRLDRVVGLGRVDIVEDHHELVPAETRDGVVGAGVLSQPLCYRRQQSVADTVAEGVVDRFEVVQVDQHHAGTPVGVDAAERLLQPLAKQRTVG